MCRYDDQQESYGMFGIRYLGLAKPVLQQAQQASALEGLFLTLLLPVLPHVGGLNPAANGVDNIEFIQSTMVKMKFDVLKKIVNSQLKSDKCPLRVTSNKITIPNIRR